MRNQVQKLMTISCISSVIIFGLTGFQLKAAEQKVVNVYNWADYLDPKVIKSFEKETGIKVVYDTYDSDNSVEAKLSSGASGYDVVNSGTVTKIRLAKIGQLSELDRSKLSNWKNLDPIILKIMEKSDPDLKYSVPNYYGTFGIIYNLDKVSKLVPNPSFDSIQSLLDPTKISKFASCGINIYDGPLDAYSIYFISKGKPGNYQKPEDITEAEAAYSKIRPYVRKIDSGDYVNALANGEICISTGFSGDYLSAMTKAASSGIKLNLKFSMPSEGGMLWLDHWVIPTTAQHKEEAYQFINYMISAKIAAANSNSVKYPTAVLNSRPLLDKQLLENPAIFIPSDRLSKLQAYSDSPATLDKQLNKSWNRFKSGK